MNITDILYAKALGSSGGGGGGGDFSTAEVTFEFTGEPSMLAEGGIYVGAKIETNPQTGEDMVLSGILASISITEPIILKMPVPSILAETAFRSTNENLSTGIDSCTGDITLVGGNMALITGDGTITWYVEL